MVTATDTTVAPQMDELAKTAGERSALLGLLATVFRSEPSPDLLRNLRAADLVDAGEGLGLSDMEKVAEILAIEYTRLFLGPDRHIPVFASGHLEGCLYGREARAVRDFIRGCGFTFAVDDGGMPDHIGIELEFQAGLVTHEAEAWRTGDAEQALWVLDMEMGFLARHLVPWVPGFCTRTVAEARFPFYKGMADLLGSFLMSEQTEVADRRAHASRLMGAPR